jgi:hypothetical protein
MKGLLTSIITVLALTGMQAQQLSASPRLVVEVTIDQLRSDYLELFSALYGERGFNRLLREGLYYRNMRYAFDNVDRSSAVASLQTGATPSVNGIIGNSWMNHATLRVMGCVDDSNFMGNYTDDSSSPLLLLSSTVGDELKIATRGKALVYSIAPFRDAAVIGAGHSGNGAYWLNENTGKWCSSTYYKELPWWLSKYNEQKAIDFRIGDIVWTPYLPKEKYSYLPDWRDTAFKYKFDDDRRNKYRRLITSPYVNDEVNALVSEVLTNGTIGRDETPDLLSVTYYAGNYMHKTPQECAMELQDAYVRLDRSIADLIEMVDKNVGLANVLFCITSTGYADAESADPGTYNIPGGEFHMNRCAALLNMYLMATYGEGKYVDTYFNNQIYLNHTLIEKKQLSLTEIQNKSADFVMQLSGVDEAYSAQRLLGEQWSPSIEKIRNGYHKKRSGDIVVEVLPGWTVMNEDNPANSKVVRKGYIPAPLIFFGAGTRAERIESPVEASCIAPTLASVMRIRAPNSTKAMAISGVASR